MEFATQLKQLRTQRGLSQDDLAAACFVSRQAVSKWETGDGTPDLRTLVKLAQTLAVSLDTLVLGAPAPAQPAASAPTTPPMNGWMWLAHYWWLLFALGGFIVWMVNALR
ncbi:helix-turn-helix domain-containing protein [Lacticaseibacillus absianus]|uniref:helix-turn-helix domain-containing protein n=1 Tax=Lacticaseibacillus absianus TaxID=2729623 RepID=UPI0015CAA269|nr:helix-turn-helix transcriptional regulator [Lacticaseibacillus absianus]